MPRFVDRNATQMVELGPCDCPVDPKPHDKDWVKLRENLSYADLLRLSDAMAQGNEMAIRFMLRVRLADWNLVNTNGKKAAITDAIISELDQETAGKIVEAINSISPEDDQLPNA